jgi:hypothetical protein
MRADDLITKGDALKAIMENAWPEDGTYGPDEKDIENAERATVEVCTEAIAALPAVAPGVRVGPLEWEESLKGRWIGTPDSKLGDLAFWIFRHHDGTLKRAAKEGWQFYPTLEAAKAAAQADYEARIIAALDTPAPAMELVEALRVFAKAADALNDGVPDAISLGLFAEGDMRFGPDFPSVADLRAARAVLAKIGGA